MNQKIWRKHKPQALLIFLLTFHILPRTTNSFSTTKNKHCIIQQQSKSRKKSLYYYSTTPKCFGGSIATRKGTISHPTPLAIVEKKKQSSDPLTKIQVSDIAADDYFESSKSETTNNHLDSTSIRSSSSSIRSSDIKDINSKQRQKIDLSGIASYSKLMIFISTTIIIWLSEPLLSLVDTTVVGKFASSGGGMLKNGIAPTTVQLAALGPATMVCDNAFYLVYFLSIAVTNQLASSSNRSDSSFIQVKTTSHALGVASILGSLITLVIFCFGDGILKFIIGEGGAMVNGVDMTSSLIASSWDYAKIRGFLAPLTVMGMIAQAVCLATLDTKTPALAVIAASVINILGDVLLVAKFKMGLRGAAIATALAGVGSSFILLDKTRKKVGTWRDLAMEKAAVTKRKMMTLPSFIALPDPKSFVSLVKLAGPIFFVLLGKIVCYSSMTLKATDFEMMSLATHNIMLRVFFFFCTFGDGFSLAVQSFLPQVLYGQATDDEEGGEKKPKDGQLREPSRSDKFRANHLLRRILLLASGMAVLNSSLTKIILQQGGTFFTNDQTILCLLGSADRVLYMMGAVFLHPLIMAFEGSILATRDLGFLVASYGVTMAILLSTLHFVTSTFTGVWKALFLFQFVRFTIFGSRVFKKTRISVK